MLNGEYKASIHHFSFAILLKVPISNFDICLIESIELFSSHKSSEKLQREGGGGKGTEGCLFQSCGTVESQWPKWPKLWFVGYIQHSLEKSIY